MKSALEALSGVHPRVCGEAQGGYLVPDDNTGPSPRVRGSPDGVAGADGRGRSIPACAGKPGLGSLRTCAPWVHPRVCGEAWSRFTENVRAVGPSPRVRGSPERGSSLRSVMGSIPACAGKPCPRRPPRARTRVHPRVCGEAGWEPDQVNAELGPSPRVRGSPSESGGTGQYRGSIRRARVPVPAYGPSPRVRGSHEPVLADGATNGSIPACAGKPRLARPQWCPRRVHPRVCGEASPIWEATSPKRGPSPRVRGSLGDGFAFGVRDGSIPACAGKPS